MLTRIDCFRIFAVIIFLGFTLITKSISSKPNFLLFLADDLGIGDIGCFGNNTLRTPNIDRLAKEGVKLTQHISASPLCTPSRAAFMTGRYPIRSGMDYSDAGRVIMWTAASSGLPPNETTFASILQQEGYTTGIIGKWHLGINCASCKDFCHHPNNHGFGYFYGMPFSMFGDCQPGSPSEYQQDFQSQLHFLQMLCVGMITLILVKFTKLLHINGKIILFSGIFVVLCSIACYAQYGFLRYWNCIVMRNQEMTEQPMDLERSAPQLVKEAHGFIERNKHVPFLLVVSFLHVHSPYITTKKFTGRSKHGLYGDNVEEMDYLVGSIVDAMEKAGLNTNTFMYFASDHGGHREINGGWNGIYKGGKAVAGWEGGIRVPGIIRWPGVIVADTVCDEPTSLMDIFPTVIHLGGGKLPTDRIIDGRNLMPLLKKQISHSEHEFLFHYCGRNLHAVRWHDKQSGAIWKAHFMTPVFFPEGSGNCYDTFICDCEGERVTHLNPPLLFELSSDPSEATPLYANPQYMEVIHHIQLAVTEHQKTISSVPQQLSYMNNRWKPWLQPCCGTFPFCVCHKDINVTSTI
ncbi:hypothetical protein GDO86_003052 [Hymenochirus boettgeri]|uniref:Sulfatase N-terminal domain-containing protein n=1 Tax=Hymenochirus boettgeri TaxID=247094 RepID=A0A8T2JZQ8_9PIPI|nr:hypothetical protein GDO86_003052 [Hymenochirus boettgeri]